MTNEDPRLLTTTTTIIWCGSDRCSRNHQSIETAWRCQRRTNPQDCKGAQVGQEEWVTRYVGVFLLRQQGLSYTAIAARFDRSSTWARSALHRGCRFYLWGRTDLHMAIREEFTKAGITEEGVKSLYEDNSQLYRIVS